MLQEAGLKDRVEATGGTLIMQSRPGEGTHLIAELPAGAGEFPAGAGLPPNSIQQAGQRRAAAGWLSGQYNRCGRPGWRMPEARRLLAPGPG